MEINFQIFRSGVNGFSDDFMEKDREKEILTQRDDIEETENVTAGSKNVSNMIREMSEF